MTTILFITAALSLCAFAPFLGVDTRTPETVKTSGSLFKR